MVVGEGGGVLDAGCEGEEVELGGEVGAVGGFGVEVGGLLEALFTGTGGEAFRGVIGFEV